MLYGNFKYRYKKETNLLSGIVHNDVTRLTGFQVGFLVKKSSTALTSVSLLMMTKAPFYLSLNIKNIFFIRTRAPN
jgi:outer membrane receptor for ferric coprogen and ferric-rhodotorulic acid